MQLGSARRCCLQSARAAPRRIKCQVMRLSGAIVLVTDELIIDELRESMNICEPLFLSLSSPFGHPPAPARPCLSLLNELPRALHPLSDPDPTLLMPPFISTTAVRKCPILPHPMFSPARLNKSMAKSGYSRTMSRMVGESHKSEGPCSSKPRASKPSRNAEITGCSPTP